MTYYVYLFNKQGTEEIIESLKTLNNIQIVREEPNTTLVKISGGDIRIVYFKNHSGGFYHISFINKLIECSVGFDINYIDCMYAKEE